MMKTLSRPSVLLPLLSLVVVFGAWELVGRSINPLLFAPPSEVARQFGELMRSGELLDATKITVQALFLGYFLAVIVGIPFGIAMGALPRFGDILQPYLYAIFSTPRVVVVPLIVVWFGIGFEARLFLVFFWSMIAISVNTAQGVRHARPDLVEVAHSFQASRLQMARHVLIPGAIPFVVSGLRIGAERAIVGVIIGEMFLQIVGLGGVITKGSTELLPAKMLCAVAVIAVLGTIIVTALDTFEKRFQVWKGPT
ncbi:inner-membrane translocator (plasmid) [Dinoroseobacter shibae DFL 12 = DSM 16493]|jgi:NitT/TauT family transport system permease protein|uniref:Inner-membrane translocator n=1 Tax=Dinoroseobacter shibae (strain DSM 16493 / NCIMB 14021 / DFL 12) TaxID=398580 RepID=A8LUI1_DINSH|nr:ABC transporter permease [Dinoroseobacter shibae]ABV95898.1 inner-membrane translocator [Dinoroseobacter shibae DFL 12 = DSM 16493]URF49213.1 ABC transporter permease [Dinoroseobacter shibae]URF53521.1 ABC transporter permease [Dinoroseobacter shibae]